MRSPYRVCFVCSGNICRSPMAESVFRARVEEAGLDGLIEADSAGTGGWHAGDEADPRTVAVLARQGYGTEHSARQFRPGDFAERDLVIALDAGHQRHLRRLAPSGEAADKVRLLLSYDPKATQLDVPDPYYGGNAGFDECLEMIEPAAEALLDAIRTELRERGDLDDAKTKSGDVSSDAASNDGVSSDGDTSESLTTDDIPARQP
ncbi:low molecular weight phosphotyrosine protein phosphatase [Streptomyces sp. A7024]|uniref:protein-tyrosine-phosphatase n=1 Tax=Streptomyces coryli TaxID=1128680 RepID=A0A6G4UDV1_9ACTN|nr:low molecular weight protein-tyrosine-phosphatase [Streptomyces coryli]NGN70344.1 low molecular weight phosphotyrosine protein phosphatase [Streptomyces coryli]